MVKSRNISTRLLNYKAISKNLMVNPHNSNENKINKEFYVNCLAYFDTLRKSGKSDNTFEDEYFFTLPAISGSGLDY